MQDNDHQFELEVFEGPLDLLLYLIRKAEVDIYDIPIQNITEQYLRYLNLMKMLDLDIAGEFLSMATTLMQIKSRLMLPVEEREELEEEDDPRWDLVRQLLEYKRFKEAANKFHKLEVKQTKLYPRGGEKVAFPSPDELPLEGIDLFKLLDAFSQVLNEASKRQLPELEPDNFTMDDGQNRVLGKVSRQSPIAFRALFERGENRTRIVVIFLALLELIRQKIIRVFQEDHFEEIMIQKLAS